MSKPSPSPTALIVGNGMASATAALDLARAGVGVMLLTAQDWLIPEDDGPIGMPTLLAAAKHPRIQLLTGTTVQAVHAAADSLTEGGWHQVEVGSGAGLLVTVCQAPRYVDSERCTACGACVEVCPILLPGENGDGYHKAIYRGGVPTSYAIDKAGTAPCRHACPIDQRAQGYVALVRNGDFFSAYQAIKRENPFPSVCGRVCNHRCEEACTRCQIDEPVAVMALKRFVADWAWEGKQKGRRSGVDEPVNNASRSRYHVAVIGAGPAGLTAARELNRLGHDVTVLEALPVPGGMMRVGIPGFRLPRERLQWEIDEILAEGVELRTNCRVENVDDLFAKGYDAVVLAVGMHLSQRLHVPGVEEPEALASGSDVEDAGVIGAVEFLRAVNLGERPDWRGRRVVVVGGGSTAMDTARVCRRLGADVEVIYRRSRAEMPAHDFEVEDALHEGVTIRFLTTPARFLRQERRVTGVECVRMELGAPDASGRRRPIPMPGSEFTVPADAVLLAIGQVSDLSLLPDDDTVVQRKGVLQHDPATLMTGRPGLFVAGDVAGTEGFVIDAIASGLKVARSVDRHLRGAHGAAEPVKQPVVQLGDNQVAQRLNAAAPQGTPRVRTRSTLPDTLLGDFEETAVGLSEAEAMAEAARCLSCGLCSECLACVQACPAGAINHQCAARTFEIKADVALWVDSRPGFESSKASVGSSRLLVMEDGADLSKTVDRALAYLGIQRSAPVIGVAAPAKVDLGFAASDSKPRVGVFLCRCGGEIERAVNLSDVAARVMSAGLPGLVYVDQVEFACHPEGNQAIRSAMAANNLDGAVLAACSCCALDQICYSCTTQRIRCKERLGVWDALEGLPLSFVNLREQCAFVHSEHPSAATTKAGDMVAASVASFVLGRSIPEPRSPVLGGSYPRTPIMATVDTVRCRGCEDCEVVCGLDAIRVVGSDDARIAQVEAVRCLGCGVCMAVCSSGAILAGDTSDAQATAMLETMGDLDDKTVVLSCNWGAYSAVEAAGLERLYYDPSVRLVRLMCAGRAHEGLILRAFAQGAARVLVLACGHEGDTSQCHYHTGNDQAKWSVQQAQRLLGLLGIDPARLALAEMRPGDGAQFAAAVEQFVKMTPKASRKDKR